MSQLWNHLHSQQEAMIQMLEQLVMLDSPSDERAAVNRVGQRMAEAFEPLGAQVERLPQTAFGDHLRVTCGQGESQVLLLGHMDTVFPVGEAEKRPFRTGHDPASGALLGWGPGAFDMKGGLVIGYFALRALYELDLLPPFKTVFLMNSDEEIGSPSSRPLIEEEARRSEVALVLEPSREDGLVTQRKGVGRFELEVQGLASHAGAAHERGVSAIKEMAHQVLRLEGMTDYGRGTTVNVGTVQGGSAVNVRPASAWAEIDLRVTSTAESERMVQAIHSLRPVNPRAALLVSGGMNRPPWEPSADGRALFERAQRLGQSLGLELWPASTGGGSDGNFTAALGVPTLDGLGIVGNDAHAVSEWVDLDSMPRRAALLAELLRDLGQ